MNNLYKKILDTVSLQGQAEREIELRQDFEKFFDRDYSISELKKVDPLSIIKEYNLKGFTFGNYVSQEERYLFVYQTGKVLEALSKVKNSKNLGFGKLIISFGADGKPKANAHFNAKSLQININRGRLKNYKDKFKGENSLIHEYGHFLDYIKGDQDKSIEQNVRWSSASKVKSKDKVSRSINNVTKTVLDDKVYVDKIEKNFKDDPNFIEYLLRPVEIFARSFETVITLYIKKTYPKYKKFLPRTYKGVEYPDKTLLKEIEKPIIDLFKNFKDEYKPVLKEVKVDNQYGDNIYIQRSIQGNVIDLPIILRTKITTDILKTIGPSYFNAKELRFVKNVGSWLFTDKKNGSLHITNGKQSLVISRYGRELKTLGNATKVQKEVYQYYVWQKKQAEKPTKKPKITYNDWLEEILKGLEKLNFTRVEAQKFLDVDKRRQLIDNSWDKKLSSKKTLSLLLKDNDSQIVLPFSKAKKVSYSKERRKKTIKKALLNRIELANKYINWAIENDIVGFAYFGSTWPTLIYTYYPIEVKNQFVYIKYKESSNKIVKERYNINNDWAEEELRYEIRYLIKSVKNGAKEENKTIPSF